MLRHRPEAKKLYNSKQWKELRAYYIRSQHGLCERCLGPGKIVHHITYINEENVHDPNITLNVDNLELLCQCCHNKEHHANNENTNEGLMFDSNGFVVKK